MIDSSDKTTDRYVLIGQSYQRTKAAIMDTIGANKSDPIIDYINKSKDDVFPYVYLALYQEVTLLYKTMNSDSIPIQIFETVLKDRYPATRRLWSQLLTNDFTHHMTITSKSGPYIDLNCLLIQFRISCIHSRSKLIKPLLALMNEPKTQVNAYFPTMSQDMIFDVQQALLEGRNHDNPKFYACPNGHVYVLFDCGRPWVIHKCRDCQAEIGGTQHKLLDTNKELDIKDKTPKGYCLNEASKTSDNPTQERNLSHSSLHIIRFVLHCALYFGIDTDENVSTLKCTLRSSHSSFIII